MTRYAVVVDGQVVNLILWDGETPYEPEGVAVALDADSPVGPGWAQVDGEWVAPPQPEPVED